MLRMVCGVVVVCFFFKHKTAYELRISDWSSDVCASDLLVRVARRDQPGELGEALHQHLQRDGRGHRPENAGNGAFDLVLAAVEQFLEQLFAGTQADEPDRHVDLQPQPRPADYAAGDSPATCGNASCRERVCQYGASSVVPVQLKQ